MNNTMKTFLKKLGGLAIACFALAACAADGIVVDENGKPVKGAYVVAYWTANVGIAVQPHTKCYRSEITTTDENGRFQISSFSGSIDPFKTNRKLYVEIFVPGYQLKSGSSQGLRFAVTPLTGSKSEQFQQVYSFYRGAACGNDDAFLPTLKARYKELVRLSETKAEIKICNSFFYDIESIEFGEKVAYERRVQRDIAEDRKGTPYEGMTDALIAAPVPATPRLKVTTPSGSEVNKGSK